MRGASRVSIKIAFVCDHLIQYHQVREGCFVNNFAAICSRLGRIWIILEFHNCLRLEEVSLFD